MAQEIAPISADQLQFVDDPIQASQLEFAPDKEGLSISGLGKAASAIGEPFNQAQEAGPLATAKGAGESLVRLGWNGSAFLLDDSGLGPIKKKLDEDIGNVTSQIAEYAVKAGIPDKAAQSLAVTIMSTPALLAELFPTSAGGIMALGAGAGSGPKAITLAEGLAKGASFSEAINTMGGRVAAKFSMRPAASVTMEQVLEHPALSTGYKFQISETLAGLYQEKMALNRKIADQMNGVSDFLKRNSGKESAGFQKEYQARGLGIEKDKESLAALEQKISDLRQNAAVVVERNTTPEGQPLQKVLSGQVEPPPVKTNSGAILPNPGPAMAQAVDAMTSIAAEVKAKVQQAIIDPSRVIVPRKGYQVTETIMNMIADGQIEAQEAARMLGVDFEAGESVPALISRIRSTSTSFGQFGNRLSQVAKILAEKLPKDSEMAQRLMRVIQESSNGEQSIGAYLYNKVDGVARPVINTWRALLVTQIGTSARNLLSQGIRVGIGVFDDASNGAMRYLSGRETAKASFSNSFEDMAAIMRRFSPEERAKLDQVFEHFPTAKAQMGANLLSDVTPTGAILNRLNILNRTQETFFRKIAFDARLSSDLTRLGLTWADFPGMEKSIAKKLVEDATAHALDMTFASNPAQGSWGKWVLDGYSKMPYLNLMANPFPRFWLNAMKFTTEFSPLGFLFRSPGSRNPEMAFRGATRALTGTMLYSAAFAVRASKFAGDKWYEVRPMPDSKPNYMVDIRNFNPFASSAFLADLAIRSLEFRRGIRPDLGYSTSDWANAVIAMRRSDFAGVPILDWLFDNKRDMTASPEALKKVLIPVVGNFIAGFATPIKNFRDIIEGGLSGDVLDIKDTKESPLLGPLVEEIPYLRDVLPDQPSVTRAGPMLREGPVKKQLLGVAGKNKTDVERELDRLDISKRDYIGNTGDRELDRLIAGRVGPAVAVLIQKGVMDVEGYNKLGVEAKRKIILGELRRIKTEVTAEIRSERQDLDLQMKLKQLPKQEREALQGRVDKLRQTPRPRLP